MKRVCLLLSFMTLGLLFGCRQTDVRSFDIHLPQVVNEACEKRVRNALQKLKGIRMQSLEFDREARTLTLSYDSMVIAHKNIEHAIIAVGFDANELIATEKARAALPPACRHTATGTNNLAMPAAP